MEPVSKEQIYDSKISPLVKQIIALCQEHGIAMVASFDIAHDGEGPNGESCANLTCNTLLPDGDGTYNPLFVDANAHIRRRGQMAPMMFTVEGANGEKTLTAMV